MTTTSDINASIETTAKQGLRSHALDISPEECEDPGMPLPPAKKDQVCAPPSLRPKFTSLAPCGPVPPPSSPPPIEDHVSTLPPFPCPQITPSFAPSAPSPTPERPPAKDDCACAWPSSRRHSVTNISADASSAGGALQISAPKIPVKDHAGPVRYIAASHYCLLLQSAAWGEASVALGQSGIQLHCASYFYCISTSSSSQPRSLLPLLRPLSSPFLYTKLMWAVTPLSPCSLPPLPPPAFPLLAPPSLYNTDVSCHPLSPPTPLAPPFGPPFFWLGSQEAWIHHELLTQWSSSFVCSCLLCC